MSDGLKNFLIFATGAALGSVVTWKIVKTKYEQIAQEEIDSVKEVYSRKKKEILAEAKVNSEEIRKAYTNTISELGYSAEESIEMRVDAPYVIPPEEFGEFDDYDTVSLTYYADKVLTDEMDEIVDDIDMIVGLDSLETFGQYEDDSVFVRNDGLKTDYEILLDVRRYDEVINEEE